MKNNTLQLYGLNAGTVIFSLNEIEDAERFEKVRMSDFYSILLILEGAGIIRHSLITLAPFQSCKIIYSDVVYAVMLSFHQEFLRLYDFQDGITAGNVLFNNTRGGLKIDLSYQEASHLYSAIYGIKIEMQFGDIIDPLTVFNYLKIILSDTEMIWCIKSKAEGMIDKS